jgi:carnitine O-acetyltransferase
MRNGHLVLRTMSAMAGKKIKTLARTLSHQHSIPEEPFSPTRKDTLLSRQDSLPKMPISPLEDVAQKYLSAVLPLLSPEQQADTKSTVDAYVASSEGKAQYDMLLQYDAKEDNYMEHFYREMFSSYDGSNHSLNPNFVLTVDPSLDTAPKRAASLTFASLHYHQAVKTGQLPILETRAGPLCMRQMPWLFGTARIAQAVGSDDLNQNCIDTSKHVAVLCHGQVFKLRVLAEDGAIATSPELLTQRFAEIAASASASTATAAVGALTAADRGVWFPEREKLKLAPGNAAALGAVDEALFVVALDSVAGLTPSQMEQNVLYGVEGTFHNRWLDKWTFVVCEDGQAGVNWEHSMLDGHTMMEMVAAVGSGAYRLDGAAVGAADDTTCTVEALPFTVDAATQAAVAEAVAACSAKAATVGVSTLEFEGFGASFIKSCKCSPDGFVQVRK